MIRKLAAFLAVAATLALSGCGYNDLQRQDEGIKAAWSEVLNQYQRRADLVPNLVATVQGAANFEKSTLEAVVNARASVGRAQINAPTAPTDPEALARFEAATASSSRAVPPSRSPSTLSSRTSCGPTATGSRTSSKRCSASRVR